MTENPDHPAAAAQPAALPPAASVGVRAVARLIDFVLLGIVNAIVVGVVVVGALLGQSGGMFVATGASSIVAGAVSAVLGAALNLAYFGFLESRDGQTIGKMVMKLRVVDASGNVPSLEQALRRNIWVAFGIAGVVPIIGGLIGSLAQLAAVITIAIGIADDKRGGRAWHDRFAGDTLVVGSAGTAR